MWLFKKKIDEELIKKINNKSRIIRYLELIVGIFLLAFAFQFFLLPTNIVCGNVSGISIILEKTLGLKPSYVVFFLNVFLLMVSYFALGKKATINSLIGSILLPIFIEVLSHFTLDVDTSQTLLMALFAGIINGLGAGLVFKAGFTSGGTDIINQIISKYGHTSIGTAMLMSDGLIVVAGCFFFGFTKFLYALVVLYLISLLSDKVLLGISNNKAVYIITDKDDEVKDYIVNYLHHGITMFNARGGYTKEKENVLMCVIPTSEYIRLRDGIKTIDEDAFFVVTDAYESFGGE